MRRLAEVLEAISGTTSKIAKRDLVADYLKTLTDEELRIALRSRLIHLAVAVLSVGGMWAVFTFALRVILPEGILLPGF